MDFKKEEIVSVSRDVLSLIAPLAYGAIPIARYKTCHDFHSALNQCIAGRLREHGYWVKTEYHEKYFGRSEWKDGYIDVFAMMDGISVAIEFDTLRHVKRESIQKMIRSKAHICIGLAGGWNDKVYEPEIVHDENIKRLYACLRQFRFKPNIAPVFKLFHFLAIPEHATWTKWIKTPYEIKSHFRFPKAALPEVDIKKIQEEKNSELLLAITESSDIHEDEIQMDDDWNNIDKEVLIEAAYRTTQDMIKMIESFPDMDDPDVDGLLES